MKLIHCADLHLDAAFNANLTRQQAKERKQELLTSFRKMVEFADSIGVRAIMIAGDLFDSSHVTKTTLHFIDDLITSHPDIDFLYLKGNHDSLDFFQSFEGNVPQNLKTFTDRWTSYNYENVVINGVEVNEENYSHIYHELMLEQSKLNIVMLHGQVSPVSRASDQEMIPLLAMKDKYIDYLALGHLHTYQIEKLDTRGVYCYSGCLQGRGFDECGDKGYVLLDIQGDKVSAGFVPAGGKGCYDIPVDISDCMTSPQIVHCIENVVRPVPSESMVNIRLTGETDVDIEKNVPYIWEQIHGCFYFCRIKDESRPKVSYDSYRMDRSLKGEFVRLMEREDLDEEEKERIIQIGLKALAGEEPF